MTRRYNPDMMGHGNSYDGIRALVVDDDAIVREIIIAALGTLGLRVTGVDSIAAATRACDRAPFDLVVADVNLPDGLGFEFVQKFRRQRDAAIVYLTSRGDIGDRLRGFDTGGDDYLVKPFDPAELVARVAAVLRRYRGGHMPAARLIARPGWTLDLVRRELARSDGALVPLTRGEFDLFSALVQASPTALDRYYLLEVVSSAEATTGLRTIDVMISRIRTKLEAAAMPSVKIVTIRGGGYRAESDA